MFAAVLPIRLYAQEVVKPKIAILEPKVGDGVSKGGRQHLNLDVLTTEMERALQGTRKFSVLTRDDKKMAALLKEQDFAGSKVSSGNAAKSGLMNAANLLILPTVQDFIFHRDAKPVPNFQGKYTRVDSGRLKVTAQVIDTQTGEIKTTFDLAGSFTTGQEVVNFKSGSPSPVNFERMAKDVSGKMADQLVDRVFPMKVMAVQNNQVFINRGKDGGLKIGDALTVFRPGVALRDPYTGEMLGSAEVEIGAIRVVRVNPKFTIA
ncbi:MAG: hypothetical protein VW268_14675, partial [Rhodospirillaceae bacterium]